MTGARAGAVLFVCVFGIVLSSCSSRDDSRAGEPGAAGRAPALTESQRHLLSLLPEDGEVDGWTRKAADVRFYDAGSLWDFINGGAEVYLACEFQEAVTSDYSNAGQPSEIVVDVYRMSNPRTAFGIYSQELDPRYDFRAIGAEGYIGGTVLNFWSGPYYVKLTAFQESLSLQQEMMKLAESVARKLGDPGVAPKETGYFPPERLVPHSVRYVPSKLLGQAYLSRGFEARYRQGENEHGLAIVAFDGAAEAAEALSRYRQQLAPARVRQLPSAADESFAATDDAYGNVVAVRRGNHLAFATGVHSVEASLPSVRALLANASR
jgi:hypothetical protein